MMMRMLRRHPVIHIVGETHYFDDLRTKMPSLVRAPLDDAARRRCEDYFLGIAERGYGRRGDPESGPLPRATLRATADALGQGSDAYFEAYCRLQAQQAGKVVWGEKTPRHVFRIAQILDSFPSARIVCMMRDPRAVVASSRDAIRNLNDAGDLPAADLEEQLRKTASYDPAIASLLWRSVTGAAVAAQRRFGPDTVRIEHYEELVAQPHNRLRELADWLRLPFSDDMLDVPQANSSYLRSGQARGVAMTPTERWRRTLSGREILIVQSICGSRMEQHGYQRERVGLPIHVVAQSWLALPLTLSRAVWANRRRTGNLATYVWKRLRAAMP